MPLKIHDPDAPRDADKPRRPRRRTRLLSRFTQAVRRKWVLADANDSLKHHLRLAKEENDWLREQLQLYRDTAQSLQFQYLAYGAEAKSALVALREVDGK